MASPDFWATEASVVIHEHVRSHFSGKGLSRCEICGVFMSVAGGGTSREVKPYDRTGKKNPNYKDGRCLDPERFKLYWIYTDERMRCQNPKHHAYAGYGGRGIEFRFSSFEEWCAELGPRPKGYTADRKDNNGQYEPGNMRWCTYKEQSNNRRKRTVYPPKINNRWARVEKG